MEPSLSCDQPDDSVDRAGDCNDSDDAIYPDAHDTPLDGIDQDCDDLDNDGEYTGDLALTTEDELTDFCTDYRGVNGSLTITDSSLVDLSELDCLLWVGENLEITATALSSASLPALLSVGEDLVVGQAESLESLAMDVLESVGGSLVIEGNPLLTTSSFVDVCDAGTALVIRDNISLVDLVFDNLQWVGSEQKTAFAGGHLEGDGLEVSGNALLAELSLPLLAMVGGDLLILGNASLETLDLPALEEVSGETTIEENEQLTSLDLDSIEQWVGDLDFGVSFPDLEVANFGSLLQISGNLHIPHTSSLQELYANSLLRVEGELNVQGPPDLTTLELGLLEEIGDNAIVYTCPSLHIWLIEQLNSVEGNIEIGELPLLPGVYLESLVNVGGWVDIMGLASGGLSAKNLVLSNLETVGDQFYVHDSRIETIVLNALLSVGASFKIINNSELTEMSAPVLQTVGSFLDLRNNPVLDYLQMPSLTTVDDCIYLEENPALTDLNGLRVDSGDAASSCVMSSVGTWESAPGGPFFQMVLCDVGITDTEFQAFVAGCEAIDSDKTYYIADDDSTECPDL